LDPFCERIAQNGINNYWRGLFFFRLVLPPFPWLYLFALPDRRPALRVENETVHFLIRMVVSHDEELRKHPISPAVTQNDPITIQTSRKYVCEHFDQRHLTRVGGHKQVHECRNFLQKMY
jgi:hypothetical protein